MTHEEQMATMRRKFACEVYLQRLSRRDLNDTTTKELVRLFNISGHWAGAARRSELMRRP